MARMQFSTKRLLIEKANTTIVIVVGVAAFVTTFSLVASKALLSKRSYQAKVIGQQEKARDQLKANIEAVDTLKTSYQGFVSRPENIIAGNSQGSGERDGDNAKIVLDALPSKYDFPALTASLEKIMSERNYKIKAITGVDDEANQNSSGDSSNTQTPSLTTQNPNTQNQSSSNSSGQNNQSNTTAVEMPFELTAEGNYGSLVDLLGVFQRSIRPIYAQKLTFKATGNNSVDLTVQGKSYFQPEKSLNIQTQVVK